ncbi:Ribose-5-phosphate isomerase A [ANME-1 cluster archaeon GoMg1]|nr:Ribose-5-phosphate isomerase A [ANME-1 cluster archaeon GoMg1]
MNDRANEDKRRRKKANAAESAVSLIKDGMVIGLGSGSTAEIAVRKIGDRIKEEELEILGVPTSIRTEKLAIECGVPLTTLSEHPALDMCIDGADQVDARLNLIKGGWGSHTREKIVSYATKKLVICVEEEKIVKQLNMPVPLEVLSYAVEMVEIQVKKTGWNVCFKSRQKQRGIFYNGAREPGNRCRFWRYT